MYHDYLVKQLADIHREEIRKELEAVHRHSKLRKWMQFLRSLRNTFDRYYTRHYSTYVRKNLSCCTAPSCCD